jgi:hypothetical protein
VFTSKVGRSRQSKIVRTAHEDSPPTENQQIRTGEIKQSYSKDVD